MNGSREDAPSILHRVIELGRTRFSTVGLVLGTLLVACSLTPSLLPRSVGFQGVVSGISMTLGYALGRASAWLWSYMELPTPSARTRRRVTIPVAVICAIVAAAFLSRATGWQNSVRAVMGMAPVTGVRPFSVSLIAVLVFGVAHLAGWQRARVVAFLSRTLDRIVPRRIARVVAIFAAAALLWTIANGVIFALVARATDKALQELDAATEDELQPPRNPEKTGSAQSLIDWHDLGRRGRRFISSAPTAADIAAFSGAPAQQPIRVYVGVNSAATARDRARLALRELIRVGAFQRSVLIVVTPTGTGWVDRASIGPVEYLHRGNIATVAVQYSYLPSKLALIAQASQGVESARAVFEEVYQYWTTLPRSNRPRLYLNAISLGMLNSELSFDLFDVLADPFEGVLWAGPPFNSRTWRRATAGRDPSSPAWLPRYRDGSVVRFANQHGGLGVGKAPWGPLRIAFLQYGSDPITFFSPRYFFHEPEWLRTSTLMLVTLRRW